MHPFFMTPRQDLHVKHPLYKPFQVNKYSQIFAFPGWLSFDQLL